MNTASPPLTLWSKLNFYLDREQAAIEMTAAIRAHADRPCCVFVHGPPGAGKTEFVLRVIRDMRFTPIRYGASDIRNKVVISSFDANHTASVNIMDVFSQSGAASNLVTVLDDVDSIFKDKGGADCLIRMVRPASSASGVPVRSATPIVCVGNSKKDKKVAALTAACSFVVHLHAPSDAQVVALLSEAFPEYAALPDYVRAHAAAYVQHDLRKLAFLVRAASAGLTVDLLCDLFHLKVANESSKTVTKTLLTAPRPLANHLSIPESNRATVLLLWHENVAGLIDRWPRERAVAFYLRAMDNICLADRVACTTFQNQNGSIGDMCSIVRTFYNTHLLHQTKGGAFNEPEDPAGKEELDIVFTKLLTKYSTEFNNGGFVRKLCQRIDVDIPDLIVVFRELLRPATHPSGAPPLISIKPQTPHKSRSVHSTAQSNVPESGPMRFDQLTPKQQAAHLSWIRDQLGAYNIPITDVKRMCRFLESMRFEDSDHGDDGNDEGKGDDEGDEGDEGDDEGNDDE